MRKRARLFPCVYWHGNVFPFFLNSLQHWDQSQTSIESQTDSKTIQLFLAITGIQLISAAPFRSKTCSDPTLIRWFRVRILKSFKTFKALYHIQEFGDSYWMVISQVIFAVIFYQGVFPVHEKLNLNTHKALTASSRHVY